MLPVGFLDIPHWYNILKYARHRCQTASVGVIFEIKHGGGGEGADLAGGEEGGAKVWCATVSDGGVGVS